MGDSVDNIPGVRGVGPKTATKLIVEYGDMEAALAGAGTMKASKLRDNLIEHAEMARLSRILRSEEHTSELQSVMRISYADFCLKKPNEKINRTEKIMQNHLQKMTSFFVDTHKPFTIDNMNIKTY